MPSFCPPSRIRPGCHAFTLLEVLVTVALLVVILIVLAQAIESIDRAWKSAASDPFAGAQEAFETVTHTLADATLDTYEDYADANGHFSTGTGFAPDHLARRSDLAFACGPSSGANGWLTASQRTTAGCAVFFTATEGSTQVYAGAGLDHLLNDLGYFVEFGDDDSKPAFLLAFSHRYRWRLRQVEQPAESLQVYSFLSSAPWIQQLAPSGTAVPMLAENVIALVVLPDRDLADPGGALAPAYRYDSRDATNAVTLNQLPPRLIVALVAIDEASATRLAAVDGANAPPLLAANLFQQGTPGQLAQDLAALDASLSGQKIGHRIFQREIQLPSCAWSNTVTP